MKTLEVMVEASDIVEIRPSMATPELHSMVKLRPAGCGETAWLPVKGKAEELASQFGIELSCAEESK